MNLNEAISRIHAPDLAEMEKTRRKLDSILKPLSSLGKLESHLVKIAGITGNDRFDFSKKAVVVFCADNGVVAQDISQSGQEVTAIVAKNLTMGDTCVCTMARVAGAEIIPVDIGIAGDLDAPGLLHRKVDYGTRDMSLEPAMTRVQAERALEVGIDLAVELKEKGYGLVATGEMGIGNTTTAAAMASVFMALTPADVTGRGAGLSSSGLRHKVEVIEKTIARHKPDASDPVGVLAAIGGYDIAGMAGLCIGGAVAGLPIVLDGVISCISAATACAICPAVREFILPSHTSAEPAGRLLLKHLDLSSLLEADMHLGEGTGAVATFPLYDMIAAVYKEMVLFDDSEIEPYEKFE